MKLLVIRHAAAVPAATRGTPDDERPLTAKGKAKFREAAKGLARITRRPDVLLTSPLPRARQTAEIAARAFKRVEPTIESALAHGSVRGILGAVGVHPADATVAIVGHEPGLSALLAHLLGSAHRDRFALKKGGAALVDLPDGPSEPGRLVWFLKPGVLRALAEG
jgi:phosphohistidine phosphatase